MIRQEKEKYEAWARIIKGMADPVRLLLVDELARCQEQWVCDLTAAVNADTSTVSRHLLVLKEAGLVADEKRGKNVFYHLCTRQVKDFLKFRECCLRCN